MHHSARNAAMASAVTLTVVLMAYAAPGFCGEEMTGRILPSVATRPLPAPWNRLLTDPLVNTDGRTVRPDLDNKYVAIYFSSGWCVGCHRFTPKLAELYAAHRSELEVIFVSRDDDLIHQLGYMRKAAMPWPAVRHDSRNTDNLAKQLGGDVLPTLAIIAPDGIIITRQGVTDITDNPGGALAKWKEIARRKREAARQAAAARTRATPSPLPQAAPTMTAPSPSHPAPTAPMHTTPGMPSSQPPHPTAPTPSRHITPTLPKTSPTLPLKGKSAAPGMPPASPSSSPR